MSETGEVVSSPASNEEQREFGAEVGRLLDLVVHSLYSGREIFLRELVANAADATDRRRFEALTEPSMSLPEGAKVRVVPDKDAKLITISDDGIGMTRDDLVQNLGTIARSGTRAFGETIKGTSAEDRPSLIGQFGVGFYAAFMVAERVEVVSRRVGSEEAWRWASDGRGTYTLAPATREQAGTDIVLHVRDDATEFLESYRLESIIKKWADHITLPITVARDGEDIAANEGTAIWRKPKSELTTEQLTEFYHHVAHAFDEPWATLHWRAEGALEFTALLFVPGARPFEPLEQQRESRIRLHVRRMFITDEAELLPPFLRFVRGVVDTEDLPLNVSREMLQATPVLARIRKAVTGKVLGELKSRAKDGEEYAKFWDNFGPTLKEGIWEDAEYRNEVAALSRFKSSAVEGWTSLTEYIGRMKPEQDAIYYLTGDNAQSLASSPQLEGFRSRGLEVLLLADAVDAFWPDRLYQFEEKKLRSVTQGLADLTKHAPEQAEEGEAADLGGLIAALKAALGEAVSGVKSSDRLVDSAVVLGASSMGPDLQMQRLLRRSGQTMPATPPVLELNPRHALVRSLVARAERGESVDEAAHLLLDLARIQDGEAPLEPSRFARRVADALGASLVG